MDVSRIEAISPKQIDWRKLTSKEIIKYDAEGVNVPPEYLQWAKEFRADIDASDKDETTYEMAHSSDMQNSQTVEQPTQTDTENSTDEIPTDEATETEETPEEDNKTEAQLKRQELEDAGMSLRNQAKTFTGYSKEASKALMQSIITLVTTEDKSNNEIESLENYMNKLLSDAEAAQNELKSEVDKLNNNRSDANSFDKINRLEQQLERYGTEAQSKTVSSEADFSGYETIINDQTAAITHGQDFGTETVNVGNDLMNSIGHHFYFIFDYIAAKRAIKTGNRTVKFSETTEQIQAQASDANSSNLSQAVSYKGKIEEKTGVPGISLAKETDNKTTQETKDEGGKTASDASTSDTTNSTETDNAASANLDKVLQAKIRKGEGLES